MNPDAPSTQGCASVQGRRADDEPEVTEPADDEQHGVKADAARPSDRRGKRDQLPGVERLEAR
jgi:hypothetical protein